MWLSRESKKNVRKKKKSQTTLSMGNKSEASRVTKQGLLHFSDIGPAGVSEEECKATRVC